MSPLGDFMNANRITVDEINQNSANTAKFINDCEEFFKAQINKVLNQALQNRAKKFILLAGPSGSGKTTTSKIISKNLRANGFEALPVSLDDFFVERIETPKWKDGSYNYETSDSIDWKLFGHSMQNLLKGEPTKLPTYNFETGSKEFGDITKISNDTIVVVEGLHALNPIIEKYLPKENCLYVYISTNTDIYEGRKLLLNHESIRFYRRLIRDLFTRATSPETTIKNWKTVSLGEELYINPFVDRANLKIDSFHPYELGVYRNVLTLGSHFDSDKLGLAKQMASHFESIDYKSVPKDSVLQEFLPKN